jgi:glycogen operon protein
MANLPTNLEMGAPYPLGANWDGLGVNFAVYSGNAERVELCLFDAEGKHQVARLPLPCFTGEIWHGYLPQAKTGLVYGYRAYGPYEPKNGHRFNPNKLLLDPYARALAGSVRWSDALFGYRTRSSQADLSFDRRDSAPSMVKAIVTDDTFTWRDDKRPEIAWSDTVIYEAHLRGLTKLFDAVPVPERGTFAGLARPEVISYLSKLGITAIELMPVQAFLQDRHLLHKNLSNYWGYNPLAYFAPEPRYLATGEANEIRVAVRRLHRAGIEVILDVVYNHTCEGSELGPTLSWRGFDNANYYRLVDGNARHCVNDTGTGNTLDLSRPRVLQMVMDSLRYWAESFHIDGFRFDLGATLGREHSGFDPGSGWFDAIRQDPVLSHLKLISEPWDIGPGGYQLGNHPPPFAEWNDRYRDAVRRYWRGDSGMRPEIAKRLSGSTDLFRPPARRPWASVNYAASHDGATLADLTSYEGKYNQANGEENRDGAADNLSRNWGVEGPTEDAAIRERRLRVMRSMLATVLFSLGTPMLLMGDEFTRTQKGNNNAYCQDNEISWVDWSLANSDEGRALTHFVARLIALRKEHKLLRAPEFLFGLDEIVPDLYDIEWLDERNVRLVEGDWNNGEGRALVMQRAARTGPRHIEILSVLLNGSEGPLEFQLPEQYDWRLLIDTANPDAQPQNVTGGVYTVQDRALALVAAVTEVDE